MRFLLPRCFFPHNNSVNRVILLNTHICRGLRRNPFGHRCHLTYFISFFAQSIRVIYFSISCLEHKITNYFTLSKLGLKLKNILANFLTISHLSKLGLESKTILGNFLLRFNFSSQVLVIDKCDRWRQSQT